MCDKRDEFVSGHGAVGVGGAMLHLGHSRLLSS